MAETDPALAPFVAEFGTIDTGHIQRGPFARLEHRAMTDLDTAIANVDGDNDLFQAARNAARLLDWAQIYGGGGIDPKLAEGMLAAQAAGTYGCFEAHSIATGQFLLSPGVFYPLHTHAAPEIYYCVSGSIDIQHGIDQPPFTLTPGQYSVTPAHRVHSLAVGDEPVLLLYAWITDLKVPIWIWSQDDEGTWIRESWRREPGEPWLVAQSEPVSPQAMAEAHP